MKIGINARVLLKGRMEGVCRYIHETTRRMVLAHPEDEFVFFFDRPFHPSFIYANNVIPVVLPPPTRDPILWRIWFEYVLPRAMRKYQLDCFVSGDMYASTRTEIPTILVSHDIAYAHFPDHIPKRVLNYYKKYFPLFHKNAAHIVAVSETTKNDLIKTYQIDSDKISVAYNDVPEGFQAFDEEEKQNTRNQFTDGQPFFIYVGSIHPRKNISGLIKGFEAFKIKGYSHKLILLGRKAWKYEDIEQQINSSTFKKDIIFLDGKFHDPRIILPAADALCYVSLLEGFGIPIVEAMKSKVPVICSNVSSMPEVAGEAALLLDPSKPGEISGAMERIVSEKLLPLDLIKKGQQQLDKFNWNESADIIYRAVKSIVEKNQS